MSAERQLSGHPASPGLAVGPVLQWQVARPIDDAPLLEWERAAAVRDAVAALDSAGAEVAVLAAGLGRADAEILETGVLMAADPTLRAAVERLIGQRGLAAPAALVVAAEEVAAQLDGIDDPLLAARAADVRSLGRRAARIAEGAHDGVAASAAGAVVLAHDLGPADVAELGTDVAAIALAGGGATGHAAIVARSLGIPMVVGAGEHVLQLPAGADVVVDGDAGLVFGDPAAQHVEAAREAIAARMGARQRAHASRALPAITSDGVRVGVLANVASAAEVEAALATGADGVGLVRTELFFLDSPDWPTTLDHRLLLAPILAPLAGNPATVRLLDFGGDKTPSFLGATHLRGIDLLLQRPAALRDQLLAVLEAGRGTNLRVLIPMVLEAGQVRAVRQALVDCAESLGVPLPLIGAMIEVPGAVALVEQIVREVDFVSIGTNDLTALQLGLDRTAPGGKPTHHPAVLRLIHAVCRAARPAGVSVAVCGEAASDPVGMPLMVGLGVEELSVGSSRVATVRAWVRALDHGAAVRVAERALAAESSADVERLVEPFVASMAS
jgi:phosphoenolpyruvate-protein kinase (PTS system EI component)